MRLLIFFVACVAFLVTEKSWSISTKLNWIVSYQSLQYPNAFFDVLEPVSGESVNQSFQYLRSGVFSDFDIGTQLVFEHFPTQSRKFKNVEMEEIIPDAPSTEVSLSPQISWRKDSHQASVSVLAPLGRSLSPSYGFEAKWQESFWAQTSFLGLELSYFIQNRPEDYYLDSNLVVQRRPEILHSQQIAGSWEQVLTERLKIRFRALTQARVEERPWSIGTQLQFAYGFTENLYFRLGSSWMRDLRYESLKNERGYFSVYQAQGTIEWEVFYRFLVNASYGFSIENETDPRKHQSFDVGVDRYGLGLGYSFRKWKGQMRTAFDRSNSAFRALTLEGMIGWEL